MKVLFVNPPVVRSKDSSKENDFRVEGFVQSPFLKRVRPLWRLARYVNRLRGWEIRYGVRAGSRWPFTSDEPLGYAPYPFFMGYAGAYLGQKGFETDIIDEVSAEVYQYGRFFREVEEANADIVVVECSTPTIDIDLFVAKKISRFSEVALAGPHLSIKAEQVAAENPWIKYFLKGEYILNSLEMATTQKEGIYESKVVRDIDSVPFPLRDYRGWDNYFDPSMPTVRPQLQVYGSKGCPFKCTFCAWPQTMYFGHVSLREPEAVAREIREAVASQGYRSIFFDDDTFNLGTERVSRFCELLGKIGLPWTMMGRIDCSPDWLYDKMVDNGCVGMRFGVETFDLDILKRVKKGIERIDFRKALEHVSCAYPRLMIHLTMMKDMPGQTEEAHRKDLEILHDIGFVNDGNIYRNYQVAVCAPFPGTEMYSDMVERYGEEAMEDFALYDGSRDTVMRRLDNDS